MTDWYPMDKMNPGDEDMYSEESTPIIGHHHNLDECGHSSNVPMFKERKKMFFPWRMKMTSTYYLSGPMSGYKDNNFPEFKRVTNSLRLEGLNIVSPHELEQDKKAFFEEHLRADLIEMLNKCDGIILLPGWPTSQGARVELNIALDMKYTVYFFNGYQLFDMNDKRKAIDQP